MRQVSLVAASVLAFMVTAPAGLAPRVRNGRLPVKIPKEFQILTILFVFASLFLGEVRNYYERFWWWDLILHGCSGLLFGIVGFMLVYVLNENKPIAIRMQPRFAALFAFAFSIAVGTLWEIFEFGVDRAFGTQMQKPSPGDPFGLVDTMWDLIVNAITALAISGYGWWYMQHGRRTFIDDWAERS